MPLGTEDAVNPTVFVSGETHIVYIGCRNHIFGQSHRIFPETEIINAIRAFGNSKE